MPFLLIAAAWLAVGAFAVALMHHRGHDIFSWTILLLFLGPLAIPLAVSAERHHPDQPDAPMHDGRFDVLIDHDGSAEATAALRSALELFGAQVTSITLTSVVDHEAASTVRGRDTRRDTQARLHELAGEVTDLTAAPVDTVILFGQPAHALQDFAAAHGYEMIIRRGAAPILVPVLVTPASS